MKYGFIELIGDDYSILGAKEERERILKEAEERREREARQQAAYDEACSALNKKIKEEVDYRVSGISENYDSRIRGVQREIDEEISENNRQKESIQRQISDWRTQQASLGFFKGKEKKALQAQIDDAQNRLNAIPTNDQVKQKHQSVINQINAERQAEVDKITAEVRSQYTMPRLEDFADL